MRTDSMRAMQIARFGGPETFEQILQPVPEPGPDEVRVRVALAGVNFAETMQRAGRYPGPATQLPAVLGSEAAGFVEAIGARVQGVSIGGRVAAPLFASMQLTGGYAECVVVPAAHAIPLPEGLTFEEAVAVMVQGTTAWLLVREVPPEGKRVLVTAAAGGVGSMLVQLCRVRGAAVVVGAARGEKGALVRSVGADLVIDTSASDWAARLSGVAGVDIIYDAVGGAPARAALATLAPGGTFVAYGALSGDILSLDQTAMSGLIFGNQSVRGFANHAYLADRVIRDALTELFASTVAGRIRPLIGGRYALRAVGEAHAALEQRRSFGKLLLVPDGSPS